MFSSFNGAPYVPTVKRQLDAILAYMKPKKNAVFIELGSGDGRLVRRAAQIYQVIGSGLDFFHYATKQQNELHLKKRICSM